MGACMNKVSFGFYTTEKSIKISLHRVSVQVPSLPGLPKPHHEFQQFMALSIINSLNKDA